MPYGRLSIKTLPVAIHSQKNQVKPFPMVNISCGFKSIVIENFTEEKIRAIAHKTAELERNE